MPAQSDRRQWLGLLVCWPLACGQGPPEAHDAGTDSGPDAACPEPDLPDEDCLHEDADGDGHVSAMCGGDDCDDLDPAAHPGAADRVEEGRYDYELVHEGQGGPGAAIAVDGESVVHAAWLDGPPEGWSLLYGVRIDEQWDVEMVAAGARSLSLAVDREGNPHVVFRDIDGSEIRYAVRTGREWTLETIGTHRYGNLVVDDNGAAHLALVADETPEDALYYVTNAGGAWASTRLGGDPSLSYNASVARAREGWIGISFTAVNSDLVFVTNRAGAWRTVVVDSRELAASSSSLLIDDDGSSHLLYQQAGRRDLRYASDARGCWAITTVDSRGETGFGPQAVRGPDGRLHVLYASLGWATRYARLDPGGWSLESIEGCPGGRLDVGLDGAVHVLCGSLDGQLYARLENPRRVDQDCDGVDGVDGDVDRYASIESGGTDCDDDDPEVFPNNYDTPGDGRDSDCDGLDE